MISRIWIINFILIIIAGFLCSRAYNVWTEPEFIYSSAVNKNIEDNSPVRKSSVRKKLSESAYRVVVDKNLFSPDREEFIPDETELEKIDDTGKKINLYGVIIMGDYKKALIDNPVRTPDDRPEKWVKVGDVVGDLIVAAINNESIFVKEGNKKYEIMLYDKKKRKARSQVTTPAKERKSSPNVVVSSGAKKKTSGSSKKEKLTDENYEVVKTPFGKIKRRKK